jgi:hypothetical protein
MEKIFEIHAATSGRSDIFPNNQFHFMTECVLVASSHPTISGKYDPDTPMLLNPKRSAHLMEVLNKLGAGQDSCTRETLKIFSTRFSGSGVPEMGDFPKRLANLAIIIADHKSHKYNLQHIDGNIQLSPKPKTEDSSRSGKWASSKDSTGPTKVLLDNGPKASKTTAKESKPKPRRSKKEVVKAIEAATDMISQADGAKADNSFVVEYLKKDVAALKSELIDVEEAELESELINFEEDTSNIADSANSSALLQNPSAHLPHLSTILEPYHPLHSQDYSRSPLSQSSGGHGRHRRFNNPGNCEEDILDSFDTSPYPSDLSEQPHSLYSQHHSRSSFPQSSGGLMGHGRRFNNLHGSSDIVLSMAATPEILSLEYIKSRVNELNGFGEHPGVEDLRKSHLARTVNEHLSKLESASSSQQIIAVLNSAINFMDRQIPKVIDEIGRTYSGSKSQFNTITDFYFKVKDFYGTQLAGMVDA